MLLARIIPDDSQEMATAAINNTAVKVFLLDNRALGMVHQWQKLFYHERYSSTILDPVPDFVKLADAYGWEGERIEKPEDVAPAIARMLASEKPVFARCCHFARPERVSHGCAGRCA